VEDIMPNMLTKKQDKSGDEDDDLFMTDEEFNNKKVIC
jgi:hypothetical protein